MAPLVPHLGHRLHDTLWARWHTNGGDHLWH
jgi:hypothetical protein